MQLSGFDLITLCGSVWHGSAALLQISSEGMPRIERNLAPRQATEEDRKEFGELFDTDSEDEDDNERWVEKYHPDFMLQIRALRCLTAKLHMPAS